MKSLILFATAAAVTATVWADGEGKDARGIFLDRGDTTSSVVKFSVLLDRDGAKKTVPPSFEFQSGDRMKFQFELSNERYVYILLRSVSAEPARLDRYSGARGIEVIRDEDAAFDNAPGSGAAVTTSTATHTVTTATTTTSTMATAAAGGSGWQLLFPTRASGGANLIPAHASRAIPGDAVKYFRMDRKPGMEKLLVVVSKTPIDFSPYFDMGSGRIRPNTAVSLKLTESLVEYSGNSRVAAPAPGSRGIEVDTYAAAAVPEKPMLIPVDLRHLPSR